eukprot:scaffold5263_cov146-Isochrysis_galbana.AAC.1
MDKATAKFMLMQHADRRYAHGMGWLRQLGHGPTKMGRGGEGRRAAPSLAPGWRRPPRTHLDWTGRQWVGAAAGPRKGGRTRLRYSKLCKRHTTAPSVWGGVRQRVRRPVPVDGRMTVAMRGT